MTTWSRRRCFTRQEVWRTGVVADGDRLVDADPPGKLAEDVVRTSHRALEVVIKAAAMAGPGPLPFDQLRQLTNCPNVVPVALVHAEVAEPTIWVEQDVFVPVIPLVFDFDPATLEPNHFPWVSVPGSATA